VTKEVVDNGKTVVNIKEKKVKDSVKTVLNNQLQNLEKQVNLNSLKNSIKDILDTKTDKDVEEIKEKLMGQNPFRKKNKN
jgi:ATP-dependent 26S proteasome regulatory subunit